jgi:hypothetical protein
MVLAKRNRACRNLQKKAWDSVPEVKSLQAFEMRRDCAQEAFETQGLCQQECKGEKGPGAFIMTRITQSVDNHLKSKLPRFGVRKPAWCRKGKWPAQEIKVLLPRSHVLKIMPVLFFSIPKWCREKGIRVLIRLF